MNARMLPLLLSLTVILCLGTGPDAGGMDWTATNYDDGEWTTGTAELGFGDGDEATVLPSGHCAYYFRKDFWVDYTKLDGEQIYDALKLSIKYDDGFVAYINGGEVKRANLPEGPISYETLALSSHEGESFEEFDVYEFLTYCHNGYNQIYLTLAIEVHQYEEVPLDLSFDAVLRARRVADGEWEEFVESGSEWKYYAPGSSPSPLESDPITVIQRPLINIPVIQSPGGTLTIECIAPAGISWWSAEIATPDNDYDLPIVETTVTHTWGDTSRYLLTASVPETIPSELYDLTVQASQGVSDTTQNSVMVIPSFKNHYYFIHLTDDHVPEHYDLTDTLVYLEGIIDEINIINPEFVLCTGDGLTRGQFEDQHEILQRTLLRLEVPIYFVSGNHELYCWCGCRERENYWKYWGWSYLDPESDHNLGFYTQDYYFDYGQTRYLGLETYCIHIYDDEPRNCRQSFYGNGSLLAKQIDWLENNLSDSLSNILFYHYDFGSEGGGMPITPVLDCHDNINASFYGHLHDNHVDSAGLTPTLLIRTGAAYDEGDGAFYRLIRIEDGPGWSRVTDYPVLSLGGLNINFPDNPNDGSHDTVRAVITNSNDCRFEEGMIKFKVIDEGKNYEVDQGEIIQVVDCGSFLTYYDRVIIPASGEISVQIQPAASPSPTLTPSATPSSTPTVTPSFTPPPTASVTPTLPFSPTPMSTATSPSTPTPGPTCGPSVVPARYVIESGDYDGDGTSDISVFRPSSGLWAIRGLTRIYFGNSTDLPASGDYNGDGVTDIAIFRQGTGLWAVRGLTRVYFGSTGDIQVPSDYDGDGCCDIGIFRETTGLWGIRHVSRVYFGTDGDWPVPGDFDGDGTQEIGIFRSLSGLWATRGITRNYFGRDEDWPIPGEYSGDGTWDISIFRASSGLWAIRNLTRAYFGYCLDWPQPGDYTGDLLDDIGIFRPRSALWAVRGTTRVYFGAAGDIPISR